MPVSRLRVLIIVCVVLAGLIGGGLLIVYRITQRIYVFSATIPESTTMNLRANESSTMLALEVCSRLRLASRMAWHQTIACSHLIQMASWLPSI
jgi:hypothetical protein